MLSDPGYSDNVHSPAVLQQFYALPRHSLDVMWLGPSTVQEFAIPTLMYQTTGLALYPLALGSCPFMATKYLIQECEKTQHPQLYLVDIRMLSNLYYNSYTMRRVTDNLKWSANRLQAIR